MTTPDMTGDAGSARHSMDAALRDLLAFEPRADLITRLDERVMAAAALGAASPTMSRRRGSGRRRTILVLLAAVIIVAGASGALALYEGMGAMGDVGFGLQLDRSVPVGATDVRDGYRVTIDRAYLDAERLMLAIRVTDELERPQVNGLNAWYAVVTDANGKWEGVGVATGRPLGRWSAIDVVWRQVPVAAPLASSRRLHVVLPHIFFYDNTASPAVTDDTEWNPYRKVEGPWTFDIELAVDGVAAVATPGAVNTVAGVPVTLKQVVIGPSAIRVQMHVDDPSGASWALLGHVRRGDQTFPIVLQSPSADGMVELQADGGTDDASGEWSVVITEVTRQGPGDGMEERISGPWTFEFQIP